MNELIAIFLTVILILIYIIYVEMQIAALQQQIDLIDRWRDNQQKINRSQVQMNEGFINLTDPVSGFDEYREK